MIHPSHLEVIRTNIKGRATAAIPIIIGKTMYADTRNILRYARNNVSLSS